MELNECINFILESTRNAVHTLFKDRLAAFDVTPIQYSLLKCLWKKDMQMPTQLAQELRIDASTVTGVIERLERKNFVERIYSEKDRRSVYVCLKPDGAALKADVEKAILDANADVLSSLSEDEITLYKRLCLQIRDTVADRKTRN